MPWIYLILTFLFAIFTGFALFSRGAIFQTASGQLIQSGLSLICFGFIGWAFWNYGWKVGLLEIAILFTALVLGSSFARRV